MKAPPTASQWVAVAFGCAISTLLVASPQRLPVPIRTGVQTAVDAVASGLLWFWGQPPEVREQVESSGDGIKCRDVDAVPGAAGSTVALPIGEWIMRDATL